MPSFWAKSPQTSANTTPVRFDGIGLSLVSMTLQARTAGVMAFISFYTDISNAKHNIVTKSGTAVNAMTSKECDEA